MEKELNIDQKIPKRSEGYRFLLNAKDAIDNSRINRFEINLETQNSTDTVDGEFYTISKAVQFLQDSENANIIGGLSHWQEIARTSLELGLEVMPDNFDQLYNFETSTNNMLRHRTTQLIEKLGYKSKDELSEMADRAIDTLIHRSKNDLNQESRVHYAILSGEDSVMVQYDLMSRSLHSSYYAPEVFQHCLRQLLSKENLPEIQPVIIRGYEGTIESYQTPREDIGKIGLHKLAGFFAINHLKQQSDRLDLTPVYQTITQQVLMKVEREAWSKAKVYKHSEKSNQKLYKSS